MTQLPTLNPRKMIQFLKRLGFKQSRQEGSHIILEHTDGRITVVPFHHKDIKRGLLRGILKDIKMSPQEFLKLR